VAVTEGSIAACGKTDHPNRSSAGKFVQSILG
jgi:hypothetical protein